MLVLCLLLVGSAITVGAPARADTAPIDPSNPATPPTVSSDPLPAPQIDGVAWQQVVVGNTVYVAGKFTTARPAGAAPGSRTSTRNNLLAYNLSTGLLVTTFVPSLNGQALTIAAAPDGSRIYVGGDFTSVNGTSRLRAAALDPVTGAVVGSFNPRMGGSVRSITATASTVFLGGNFTSIGSTARSRLAAVRASDGALLPWAPLANGRVNALAVSPDGGRVLVGGAFTTLNGSGRPGYGLGWVDATTGASVPLAVNDVVRNGGTDSAILSLASDGTSFYGTGYIFGTGGNLEGAFRGRWSDGTLTWVEDCHGDTYSVWASSTAVYTAGHAHYCGNIGGFPEANPRTWWRAVAFSKAATRTATADIHGYPSFTGRPAPDLLNWYTQLDAGTATGQYQGPWTVTGTEQYVAMAGEFRTVNGKAQQGLVRFAVGEIAPNIDGPRVTGSTTDPVPTYLRAGEVRVRWQTNWDRDNQNLTYRIIRDGAVESPTYTGSVTSSFWSRPFAEFVDRNLAQGQHTYRVLATDPFGNSVSSGTVAVNVPVGGTGEPVNTPPTASFTLTPDGLTVVADGTASSDPDGSIVTYTWDFGGGVVKAGSRATHTYPTAGSYAVRLSVTDDDGAVTTSTRQVTVSSAEPPPVEASVVRDTFSRTVSGGLGAADQGGSWSLAGSASLFSVAGGQGTITLDRPGAGPGAYLTGVSSTRTDSRLRLALSQLGTGSGTYVWLSGRDVGTSSRYQAKVHIASNGAVRLDATRVIGGSEVSLLSRAVPGVRYQAGQQLQVRLRVVGVSPTSIEAKLWPAGSPEPAEWLVSATDSTAALQTAGGVGIRTYLSSGAGNAPIRVLLDDLTTDEVP
ncbi:PKD domain-containing protein [Arthrobacter agilis]|uniref:PKD domain-containing protein n=1 Tax=Arthrobacter agilis TaxID=37921 RepID=UPI002366D181|nr:PKD domain-containing protein [Arthrobacter agilis]WDF34271.1 PKD domain-containing protein [Arthrobacter agilis]